MPEDSRAAVRLSGTSVAPDQHAFSRQRPERRVGTRLWIRNGTTGRQAFSVFAFDWEQFAQSWGRRMHYREFHPHPRLREFVKCFWTLQHDYSQGVHTEEQLPPKGEMELIFHYGN